MNRTPIFFVIIFIVFASMGVYSIFNKNHDYSDLFYKCVKGGNGADYSTEAINLFVLELKEVNDSTSKFSNRLEYEQHMKEWNETTYTNEYGKMNEKSKIDLRNITSEVYANDDEKWCIVRFLVGKSISSNTLPSDVGGKLR